MVWANEGRLSVTVHSTAAPSGAEWQRYLDDMIRLDPIADRKVIVWSYGGGPDLGQRKRLVEAVKGREAPVALFTSSAVMRGIGVALSWFNPKFKIYAPGDFD